MLWSKLGSNSSIQLAQNYVFPRLHSAIPQAAVRIDSYGPAFPDCAHSLQTLALAAAAGSVCNQKLKYLNTEVQLQICIADKNRQTGRFVNLKASIST